MRKHIAIATIDDTSMLRLKARNDLADLLQLWFIIKIGTPMVTTVHMRRT
jgi:hypothetical protein